eukprot:SAG31_NODE_7901_length_1569_cov_3.002398_1_plen_111_part_10
MLQRKANHWVNNEAVLVECDPDLIPTVGERRFRVTSTGEIYLHAGGFGTQSYRDTSAAAAAAVAGVGRECLALLPVEGAPYPPSVRHHPTGDHIVSRSLCSDSTGYMWTLE